MSPIDPSPAHPANEPPLAQALHGVRDTDASSRLVCHCGHCPINEDTGDIERAVDACLLDALGMVDSLTRSPFKRPTGDLLALHSLHNLLTHGRLLCCVQRHTFQTWAEHGA
jgi:hypothetical protein